MSMTKIEYPTLEMTRAAAAATHDVIDEQDQDSTTIFFKVTKVTPQNINYEVIGWFNPKTLGVVYEKENEFNIKLRD